jgi:hypothetical protein
MDFCYQKVVTLIMVTIARARPDATALNLTGVLILEQKSISSCSVSLEVLLYF